MVQQRDALNTLMKLNRLSREIEVDFDTFATIMLYSITALAQCIEQMPPSVQMQAKLAVVQSVDEVTREAGDKENKAAWKLLEGLGLADVPCREDFQRYVEKAVN